MNDLLAQLKDFPMDLECNDELVWTGDSSSLFFVNSLIKVLSQNSSGDVVPKALMWKSLAPLESNCLFGVVRRGRF